MKYRYLSDLQQAALREQAEHHEQPVVTDDVLAAWEADHYAHALCLETCSDPSERRLHRQAMADIEAALRRDA